MSTAEKPEPEPTELRAESGEVPLLRAVLPQGKGRVHWELVVPLLLLLAVRGYRLTSSTGVVPIAAVALVAIAVWGLVLYPLRVSTTRTQRQAEELELSWSAMFGVSRQSLASLGAWKGRTTSGPPVWCRVGGDGQRVMVLPGRAPGGKKADRVEVELSAITGSMADSVTSAGGIEQPAVTLFVHSPKVANATLTLMVSKKGAEALAKSPLARFFA